jgi:hypothetical protein
MDHIAQLAQRLLDGRFRPRTRVLVSPGVYALFIDNPGALPTLAVGTERLLYIGMTADVAGNRNHFDYVDSGGSSPRRSLGALLREQLHLEVLPRSDGNCTNYRFSKKGEAALTDWMRRNLSMSHVPLDPGNAVIEQTEKQLIAYLKPPLNLSGFPGGDARKRLKQLRTACADEARGRLAADGDPGRETIPTTAQLTDAINTLANLVRCAYLKRALANIEPRPRLNFWRVIYGNLLDTTVMEWCKLFGSDDEGRQHVHWKNLFKDQKDDFRAGLLRHVRASRRQWDDYWKQMKTYRDKFAAHLDPDRREVTHYPELELAIASSGYYYSKIITELRRRGVTR